MEKDGLYARMTAQLHEVLSNDGAEEGKSPVFILVTIYTKDNIV